VLLLLLLLLLFLLFLLARLLRCMDSMTSFASCAGLLLLLLLLLVSWRPSVLAGAFACSHPAAVRSARVNPSSPAVPAVILPPGCCCVCPSTPLLLVLLLLVVWAGTVSPLPSGGATSCGGSRKLSKDNPPRSGCTCVLPAATPISAVAGAAAWAWAGPGDAGAILLPLLLLLPAATVAAMRLSAAAAAAAASCAAAAACFAAASTSAAARLASWRLLLLLLSKESSAPLLSSSGCSSSSSCWAKGAPALPLQGSTRGLHSTPGKATNSDVLQTPARYLITHTSVSDTGQVAWNHRTVLREGDLPSWLSAGSSMSSPSPCLCDLQACCVCATLLLLWLQRLEGEGAASICKGDWL
jgi:hypothetical protein